MDSIIYLDSTGQPHYNVKLTGWGKDARIDGKTWNEIKDNVWAWEYMNRFEEYFLYKKIKPLINMKWGIKCS